MNRKLLLPFGITLSFLTMVAFQNCGSPQFSASQKGLSGGIEKLPGTASTAPITEVAIDEAALYSKVVWTEADTVFDRNGQQRARLDLDLSSGQMKIEKSLVTKSASITQSIASCSLTDSRLSELDTLLKSARVCRAQTDNRNNAIYCMALAESDIQLVNSSSNETRELRPNVCNSGIFLCDGLDDQLRLRLIDLVKNPPANCQSN